MLVEGGYWIYLLCVWFVIVMLVCVDGLFDWLVVVLLEELVVCDVLFVCV